MSLARYRSNYPRSALDIAGCRRLGRHDLHYTLLSTAVRGIGKQISVVKLSFIITTYDPPKLRIPAAAEAINPFHHRLLHRRRRLSQVADAVFLHAICLTCYMLSPVRLTLPVTAGHAVDQFHRGILTSAPRCRSQDSAISPYGGPKVKNGLFSTPPLFDTPLGGTLEFLDEIYPAKTRWNSSYHLVIIA